MESNSSNKTSVDQTLDLLDKNLADYQRLKPVSFEEFLTILTDDPSQVLRNIFQAFHDMIKYYVDESEETVTGDMDKLTFTNYDCSRLFVEDSENPYFPDMLFANRFMKQMEYLRHGTQQNRIYIFYGPHGCGKSTFLNNLLKKFEIYANTEEGRRYEIVWRIDISKLQDKDNSLSVSAFEKLIHYVEKGEKKDHNHGKIETLVSGKDAQYLEIPCIPLQRSITRIKYTNSISKPTIEIVGSGI